jgi:hypothetical protein
MGFSHQEVQKNSYAAPQKFQDAITVQVGQHKKNRRNKT